MHFVLDPYAARSCALKTANAFTPDLEPPTITRERPPFFHDADEIEKQVVDALAAGGASLVDLRGLREESSETQEAACLKALASGVDVIVGGMLPRDWANHRVGSPSLLVREPAGGYHPVQIKFHRVLEGAHGDETPVELSSLKSPTERVAVPERRYRWSTRLQTALQVAHYRRVLERTGFAAEHPWAGLIGLDQVPLPDDATHQQVITWLDLAAEVAPPNPRGLPDPEAAPLISTLARYDSEHQLRVDLAERAAEGRLPNLVPIVNRECSHCVWQQHCLERMDADDVSLRINKAPLDMHEVRVLRELGVTTISDLAAADLEPLLDTFLVRASHRTGGERRLRLAHHRAQLLVEGEELERETTGPIDLPRHDLEIDIDIETSADDRAYLWGFYVDDSHGDAPYYVDFSEFDDLDADGEVAVAERAFAWLREITEGRDAAVYHYSDYEVIRVNRVADKAKSEIAEWAREYAASHFVDLFRVVKSNFFGANGLGLKVVATATTGFEWRDADPGGLNSQRWFDDAVHLPEADDREAARVRVLEYNEDDVRATWHLRAWLRSLD